VLSLLEREEIPRGLAEGQSTRKIAALIQRALRLSRTDLRGAGHRRGLGVPIRSDPSGWGFKNVIKAAV
jgi:hypothetical protein